MMGEYFMVLDVQTVGPYGGAYSAAWKVIDGDGHRVASAQYSCHPYDAVGTSEGHAAAMRDHEFPSANCPSPRAIRDHFWDAWVLAAQSGAALVCNGLYPTVAAFLARVLDDDASGVRRATPFAPVLDVESVCFAAGLYDDDAGPAGRVPGVGQRDTAGKASRAALRFATALAVTRKQAVIQPEEAPPVPGQFKLYLTAESYIKSRYPDSYVWCYNNVWSVRASESEADGEPLGTGATKGDAWVAAASRVKDVTKTGE